jgi:DNA (cytosine-5)-methyltransferase 3A
MSGGQIAWKELGYPVGKYFTAEVDKFAIKQTQRNFPDTIQLGDVRNVDVSKLPKIDLLIGGSPCTDLSFAGKQSGLIMDTFDQYIELRDEYLKTGNEDLYFHNGKFQQSILFWEYLRILKDLKKVNPDVKFLLENVKMTKKNQLKFNRNIGLMPNNINSNLVSAQNRDRLYWTNIRTKKDGLFGELCTDIPQPKDRGIFLKDILQPESEIDKKYYLSDKALTRAFKKEHSTPKVNPDKTGTLNTKNNSGQCSFDSGTTLIGLDINKKAPTQRSSTGRCLDNKHNYQIIKLDKELNIKADQDKASTFTSGGNSGGNHSDMDIICVRMVGRNLDNPSDRKAGSPRKQRLEPKIDGKTNCITSVAKDNLIMTKNYVQWDASGKGYKSQSDRGYFSNSKGPTLGIGSSMSNPKVIIQKPRGKNKGGEFSEKSPTLTSNSFEQNNILKQDITLRRLTTAECARLQTIPGWYVWIVSSTQIYKLLGNGFTIEVIKHILSYYKPIEK